MLTSAAAPLSKDLVQTMYKRLRIPVIQAYGLSETSPASHYSKWEEWERSMGSIGRPLPNMECKVISVDGGEEVGVGQIGEFWLRGPNVFKGYLNNPAATTESLTPDGWFRTGDVGYFDEDGMYYITDRLKELIKFNGFQVAPAGMLSIGDRKSELTSLQNWKASWSHIPRSKTLASWVYTMLTQRLSCLGHTLWWRKVLNAANLPHRRSASGSMKEWRITNGFVVVCTSSM